MRLAACGESRSQAASNDETRNQESWGAEFPRKTLRVVLPPFMVSSTSRPCRLLPRPARALVHAARPELVEGRAGLLAVRQTHHEQGCPRISHTAQERSSASDRRVTRPNRDSEASFLGGRAVTCGSSSSASISEISRGNPVERFSHPVSVMRTVFSARTPRFSLGNTAKTSLAMTSPPRSGWPALPCLRRKVGMLMRIGRSAGPARHTTSTRPTAPSAIFGTHGASATARHPLSASAREDREHAWGPSGTASFARSVPHDSGRHPPPRAWKSVPGLDPSMRRFAWSDQAQIDADDLCVVLAPRVPRWPGVGVIDNSRRCCYRIQHRSRCADSSSCRAGGGRVRGDRDLACAPTGAALPASLQVPTRLRRGRRVRAALRQRARQRRPSPCGHKGSRVCLFHAGSVDG